MIVLPQGAGPGWVRGDKHSPVGAAARALYYRCGFRDSHRYHYMVAP